MVLEHDSVLFTPQILYSVPYIFSRYVITLMCSKCGDLFVCVHDGMILMYKCWLEVT
jgi:hypothetical protein